MGNYLRKTERMQRYINCNSVNKIYQKCQRYVMILELIDKERKTWERYSLEERS